MERIEYEVLLIVENREIYPIFAESPESAASRVETLVRFGLAQAGIKHAKVTVQQVDYKNEEGEDSHWYPPS